MGRTHDIQNRECKNIVLDVVRREIERHIPSDANFGGRFDLEMFIGHIARDMAIRLTTTEAGIVTETHRERSRKLSKSETVSVPATWWDHFKLRWFPKWLQRRFPANKREIETVTTYDVEFNRYTYNTRVCPHIRVPADGLDFMVHVNWLEDSKPHGVIPMVQDNPQKYGRIKSKQAPEYPSPSGGIQGTGTGRQP